MLYCGSIITGNREMKEPVRGEFKAINASQSV
jgi:hypothetical protein